MLGFSPMTPIARIFFFLTVSAGNIFLTGGRGGEEAKHMINNEQKVIAFIASLLEIEDQINRNSPGKGKKIKKKKVTPLGLTLIPRRALTF